MRQYILILFLNVITSGILCAQCYPDRHSTNWFDGWISCEPSPTPNGSGEKAHWIMYDFGEVYKLGQMTVWNTNDPSHLDWGLRDVLVQASSDGVAWIDIGTYTFSQANGSSIYEGFEGPDLGGAEGRYLLITAQSNWGGTCYGLSEIRIAAEEIIISSVQDPSENACFTVSASPNPFSADTDVEIISRCADVILYQVVDVLGRTVRHGELNGNPGSFSLKAQLGDLPQGTYYLRVQQNVMTDQLTLLKFNRS